MTHLAQAILALLLAFPRHGLDLHEPDADRRARLTEVALATEAATDAATCSGGSRDVYCVPEWSGSREDLAAMLVMLAELESGLAKHVHEGRCRVKLGECDGGRAVSPWQVQRTRRLSARVWALMRSGGAVGTRLAALQAASAVGSAFARCKDVEGAVAAYARGLGCKWEHAPKRVAFYRRVRARLSAQIASAAKD